MYPGIPASSRDRLDEYVTSGRFGGRPEAADAVRRARPYRCPKPAMTGGSADQQLSALAKRSAGSGALPTRRRMWRR